MNRDQILSTIVLALAAVAAVVVFVFLLVAGPVRDAASFGGSSVARPTPTTAATPRIGEPLVVEAD